MKTKQYSVKVFETTISDENKFISFFDANYKLFKEHLILIKTDKKDISENLKRYLNDKNLRYLVNTELPKRQSPSKNRYDSYPREEFQKKETEVEKKRENLKVLDSLLRSGQELNIDGDLLLLNRVNSGATININGNLIITQIVDGDIRCNGNFMMLKASPKANIVFHEVEVDNSYLKERLNRVELKNNEIIITPVLKETNWA